MTAVVLTLTVAAFVLGRFSAHRAAEQTAADAYASGHAEGMAEQQRIDGLAANAAASWRD